MAGPAWCWKAAAAAAWYRTGEEEKACLGALDRAWGHQVLKVEDYQHGAPCQCLCLQVSEAEAPMKGWWRTVVEVGACCRPVGSRLGEAVEGMCHSGGTWGRKAEAGKGSTPV